MKPRADRQIRAANRAKRASRDGQCLTCGAAISWRLGANGGWILMTADGTHTHTHAQKDTHCPTCHGTLPCAFCDAILKDREAFVKALSSWKVS